MSNELALLRRLDAGIEKLGIPPRQADVVRLRMQGLTRKEIARELSVSEQAVKNHITETYNRTGASTSVQLLRALLGAPIVEG